MNSSRRNWYMYKFVIVTDSDRASGFRLAGVEVFEAGSNEEAKKVIAPLLYKDDIGIVAVNEEFMLTLDEKMMTRIEKLSRPLIIPIPSKSKEIDRRSYIERLLRKAIGYNIVMRR
jgi:V/A-type H+-transporting ATPase subunit F